MLVFLIFVIALVMAILSTIFICVASREKVYKTIIVNENAQYWWEREKEEVKSKFWQFWYNRQNGEVLIWITSICIVLFSLVCIGLSIGAIVTSARGNVYYEQMQYQYIVLSERLEEDNNNYHLFYEDICNYNNAILEDRYWADNFWINWYHNGKIKDLPLIGE